MMMLMIGEREKERVVMGDCVWSVRDAKRFQHTTQSET